MSSSDELVCPITLEPFTDPTYFVADGFTYEHAALRKWFRSGQKRNSPMGFPLPRNPQLIGWDNHNLLKKNPYECPITKEEMKDPIIVQNGFTYEHDALLQAIKQTICKGKYLHLGFSGEQQCYEIEAYPNKILWKPEYSVYRKPFVMPPLKEYSGYDFRRIPMYTPYHHGLHGNATSLFKPNSRMENEVYVDCFFNNGCFKNNVFTNCQFENCVFRNTCFCSKFKNCLFNGCDIMHPRMDMGRTRLPGCQFKKCSMIEPNKISNHTQDYGVVCKTTEEVIETFKFQRVKELDITFFLKNK